MSEKNQSPEQRRREALRRTIRDLGISPASWARDAGLSNANAIYNFLSGRSNSLSHKTYEKLAAARPGLTISHLIGETEKGAPTSVAQLVVKGEVRMGQWRDDVDYDPGDQQRIVIPWEGEKPPRGLYALLVADRSADEIYPEGTLLSALPVWHYEHDLESGDRVIVHRYSKRGVEVTVRELVLRDGRAFLCARSTLPEFRAVDEIPWPIAGERHRHEDVMIELAAIVVGAMRYERAAQVLR